MERTITGTEISTILEAVTISHTCKTSLNKESKSVNQQVKLNFSGVSVEELIKLAIKPVIIAEQNIWRDSGTIPEKVEVSVRAQLDRARTSKPKPKALDEMTVEELMEYMKIAEAALAKKQSQLEAI